MLKKLLITLCVSFMITSGFSQEKVKGNKNVTLVETKIEDFKTIAFGEKFKIELIQSDTPSVEIETDENLHEVIQFSVIDSVLSFSTTAKIQSSKRINITVNITKSLQHIEVNGDAEVIAANTLKNDSLVLKVNDYAKAFLNIKNKNFKFINNNKATFGFNSKSKLNIESDIVFLELSEKSKTEALIESDSLQVYMYQSADAKIEGETELLKLNTINSSSFNSRHLTTNECELTTEDSSSASVYVLNNIILNTSGSSKVELYGNPKITIESFKNTSTLSKKEL